jgi:hypothetical protein
MNRLTLIEARPVQLLENFFNRVGGWKVAAAANLPFVDDTFGNRNPSGHAKRDRTAQKKLCDPVLAASISIFQKANLKPKLVPTKSFTPELKLCWPPLTQL